MQYIHYQNTYQNNLYLYLVPFHAFENYMLQIFNHPVKNTIIALSNIHKHLVLTSIVVGDGIYQKAFSCVKD